MRRFLPAESWNLRRCVSLVTTATLACLAAVTGCEQSSDSGNMSRSANAPRYGIIGGSPAKPFDAPWQAELYSTYAYGDKDFAEDRALPATDPEKAFLDQKQPWERAHRCGGVYIGDDWVLTAAHCITHVTGDFLAARRVRVGTQDLTRGGWTYRIDRAVVHKDYDDTFHANDIALVHFERNALARLRDRKLVRPIRLLDGNTSDTPLADNDPVSVTGWGVTAARDPGSGGLARDGSVEHASPVLLEVELVALPRARCEAVAAYKGAISDKTICAGSTTAARDSCNGDSGGPLTRMTGEGRVLVGLVSWGRGCAVAGIPGIYTRVSAYRNWIAQAKAAPAGKVSRM